MKQQVRHEAERNRLHRLKNPYVNSLFLRLMLLTAVITLVTVLLASLLPFSYLKTELRTDIENYNNQRLLHVKNTVDSTALSPVAAAFSDIVLSNQVSQASGFSGVGEDIKSSGLYSIYGLLGRKNVQYSLTDIALYNPRSKVLLSATYGITYLSGTTVKLTSDVSWVEKIGLIPSGTRSAIWLAPRAFPDGSWQAGENHLLVRLCKHQRCCADECGGVCRTKPRYKIFSALFKWRSYCRAAGGNHFGRTPESVR